MQFVIITGLSGAGKSTALKVFEDLGFFCVDNLPPALLPKFADLCLHSDGRIRRVALGIDIRGREFFDELFAAVDGVSRLGVRAEILFLDAADEVLVRRFKETRRKHPLAQSGSILDGIHAERRRLEAIKGRAHRIIDTSALAVRDLRDEIASTYLRDRVRARQLEISLVTFGYKYGIPMDADMLFDVRFLPNPHYQEGLRRLPGTHARVRKFVLDQPETREFMERLNEFCDYLLPQFVREGKTHLTVGLGCTGGRHRSVVLGEVLARHLRRLGHRVRVRHRDLRKDEREDGSAHD
ncbi:MAG: RNase adapter RapZ [Armatimonadota bacterium]|nr:RNase adapter RapZ [Armatimonadota bacterium]MDR7549906.1 RNase adapter RapZ [Armatimonadota bacterium]